MLHWHVHVCYIDMCAVLICTCIIYQYMHFVTLTGTCMLHNVLKCYIDRNMHVTLTCQYLCTLQLICSHSRLHITDVILTCTCILHWKNHLLYIVINHFQSINIILEVKREFRIQTQPCLLFVPPVRIFVNSVCLYQV